MELHVVTAMSTEKESDGSISFVRARLFGVFTSREMADRTAERFGGTVDTVYADGIIDSGKIIQSWDNV